MKLELEADNNLSWKFFLHQPLLRSTLQEIGERAWRLCMVSTKRTG